MTDTRKKQAEHLSRKVESAMVMLAKFDQATITELLRRGEQSPEPDGFPGGGYGNGGKSSDVTTSTEAAALRGLPNATKKDANGNIVNNPDPDDWSRHVVLDPIGDFISEIIERLTETYDIARILDKRRQVVLHAADSKRGREPVSAPCRICHEAAAVKGAMCTNDYNDWHDHGSPDRLLWEMWKHGTTKKDADTDGTVLMVPECPPPSQGHTARRGPHRVVSVPTLPTTVMQEV